MPFLTIFASLVPLNIANKLCKMMKRLLVSFSLIALLSIVLTSCKKDPCEDKICLNGGACVDGTCLCTSGFTGGSCETALTPDLCAGVSCVNGGYCANGACVCPQGFTGANCSQQVTPNSMRITSIKVTRFPATDNGAGWDLTSGPDIYPNLSLGATVVWDSPNYNENANPSLVYTFTPSPAIVLSNPTSQYTLRLYDYDDLDADDFMGGVNFTPYSSTNGFPSEINLDPPGGPVAFQITVSYVF